MLVVALHFRLELCVKIGEWFFPSKLYPPQEFLAHKYESSIMLPQLHMKINSVSGNKYAYYGKNCCKVCASIFTNCKKRLFFENYNYLYIICACSWIHNACFFPYLILSSGKYSKSVNGISIRANARKFFQDCQ